MVFIIIILTAIISIAALNNPQTMDKLRFNAYFIKHNKNGTGFFPMLWCIPIIFICS